MASSSAAEKASGASPVVDLVKKYAKVCASTPTSEYRTMAKLAEAAKSLMVEQVVELLAEAGGAAVLQHYSSDGTPQGHKKKVSASSGDVKFVRTGAETQEFLVQHAFYRTYAYSQTPTTVVVLKDPTPLQHGKTATAIFGIAVDHLRTPRQLGHSGISVCHYAFDRAVQKPMERMFKQYHAHLAPDFEALSGGKGWVFLALLEWVESTGCGLHDIHNALKWSMFRQFNDSDLMNDVWIIMASARNSFGMVHSYLLPWLNSVVTFVPEDELPPAEDMGVMWSALGLDPNLVELLAGKLRLYWKGNELQVLEERRNDPDLLEHLSTALLGVWAFQTFSTLRWVTVGSYCRTCWASCLSGFLHW